jgi:hypothetical protein
MYLITRQLLASQAAQRWYGQYYRNGRWYESNSYLGSPEEKYAAMLVLGDSTTPEAINAIIGNDSWTSCICDDCGQKVEAVVSCGQEPDYDSSTAKMCKGCLKAALKLL